jgi:hypothetical protein
MRLWSSTYEAVTSLVSQSPRVRKLLIHNCPITAHLISTFSSTPHLNSLVLRQYDAAAVSHSLTETPIAIRIQDLESEPSHSLPPSYFIKTLNTCISSLIALEISSNDIPQVLAVVANTPLALRTLTISATGSMGEEEASTTCRLLMSCPELRAVTFPNGSLSDVLTHLPNHALPNLESVTAPPNVVRALLPGRPIQSIKLLGSLVDPITPSTFDLYRPSTVPIRNVMVTNYTSLSQNMFTCLIPATKHVTHLSIRFWSARRGEEIIPLRVRFSLIGGVSSHPKPSIQKLFDLVLNALSKWPELRVCHVTQSKLHPQSDLDRKLMEKDAGCPIAPKGNPRERGHPSLEELRLFSRFTWIWFPGEGWTCREFGSEP